MQTANDLTIGKAPLGRVLQASDAMEIMSGVAQRSGGDRSSGLALELHQDRLDFTPATLTASAN